MDKKDLLRIRLRSLQIAGTNFKKPEDLVAWMGGIQAQDYEQAKYCIGVRMPKMTDDLVEKAIADRMIVRSWPMRNTLHFVNAKDLRWMLKLLRAEMETIANSTLYKQLELDAPTLKRAYDLIIPALEGGRQLTRLELTDELERGGMIGAGRRLSHILYRAGQDGIICFGTKKGNQHGYTLLDEWIPATKPLTKQESLAELAKRYFQSHGPATLQDFARWSGLSLKEGNEALGLISADFKEEMIEGKLYYWQDNELINSTKDPLKTTYLLPGFDEYVLGYADKSACLDDRFFKQVFLKNGIFCPVIVDKGEVTGIWKRTIEKKKIHIELTYFDEKLIPAHKRLISACKKYSNFMGMDLN